MDSREQGSGTRASYSFGLFPGAAGLRLAPAGRLPSCSNPLFPGLFRIYPLVGLPRLQEWDTGTTAMRRSFWRRHGRLKWLAGGLAALLAVAAILIWVAARRAEPFLRALIVNRLEERFHSRVELDSFHISLAQGLRAEGKGLRIWPPAPEGSAAPAPGAQSKPLIDLAEFHFRAPLHWSSGQPIHIWTVTVEGFTVDIPPQPRRAGAAPKSDAQPAPAEPAGADLFRFQIDSVVCRRGRIVLEDSNPAKQPLEFDIQTIKVEHVNAKKAMDFEAVLTNPRPAGLITTKGRFGPWTLADPGTTPIDGVYRFEHAELSAFKGIAGTLSSIGRYSGSLRDMTVDGETDTPNFSLTHFGTAMPLRTTFHAKVDGSNGDTWLEPVHATLGHTNFTARGKIVQVIAKAGVKGGTAAPEHPAGHDIELTVDVPQGEIGDFLRLASSSGEPLLTGTVQMKTTFELPPGARPLHDRIRLNGSFAVDGAQFTNPKLQDRIGDLSLRGLGKPDEAKSAAAADVHSSMRGDFTMAGGAIDFSQIEYDVPGATIALKGVYGLDGETLSFRGTAKMEATVSQMVGGWKGWLLRPADRFFKKDGAGTKVSVHIYGTRQDPQFGVDF